MTDFNVTVTDQDQQVLDVDVQIQTVQAIDETTVVVDGETVQVVSVAASAAPIVETTDEHVHLTAQEQKVEVREGGGIALTVEQTGGVGTFIALSDTPAAYSGSSGYGVRVKSTLDGVEFFDMGLASILSRLDAVDGVILTLESGYAALELSVSGLTSTAEGHASAILQLQTDVDAAEGTISSHASLIAAVQASVTTAEGNISANAASILAMDVRVTSAEGNISSHASLLLQVSADLETAKGDILSHASSISSLQSSVTSLDGDVTALSQSVIAVQASLQTTNNNVAVNSSAISSLTASVSANESAIAANAQSIIDLGVDLDAAEVNISANASDIITVDAKIDTHMGSATAHASIVQALEVSITNAQTGVTNNASAIVSLETDVSDIEGDVYAAYTVTLDVNGKITGIELIGGGSSSEFNIRADKFALYTSSAALSISGDADGNIEVAASKYIKFIGHASTPAKLYFVYGSTAASMMGQYANALAIYGELVGGAYCDFYISNFTDVSIQGRDDVTLRSLDTAEDGTASAYIGCGTSFIKITSEYGSGTSGALDFGVTAYAQSTAHVYYKYLNSAYRIYPSNNDAQYLGDASYAWKGLYLSSNIRFTGSTGYIYVDAVTSGDSYLRLIGTTTTTGDYFYVMAYTDDSNTAAVIRALYGDYYIQIYHNGTDAIVLGKQGLLRFYANQASAGYLNSSGDLYLGGAVYESQWSLDKQYVDEKKWAMLQSIVAAYESHDGGKLDPALRKTHEGLGIQLDEHNKPMPGTGKATVGRSNSDLIQVATACIAELLQRVEALEKAA